MSTARPVRPAVLFPEGISPDGAAVTVNVGSQDVEAIARRVVELLLEAGAPIDRELVDAATLARRLGVSADTVYRHADELGAQVVGGERGRGRPLRFDPDKAAAAWETGRSTGDRSQGSPNGSSKRKRRRSSSAGLGSGVDPLPYRGQKGAE